MDCGATLQVHIVGIVGVPANYGGFETVTEQLLRLWRDDDSLAVTVYCSGRHYDRRLDRFLGARLRYLPVSANGMSSVVYDCWAIARSCFSDADVILAMGVSGAPAYPLARLMGKTLVVNVDGLEWKRKKWNAFARLALRGFEWMSARFAHELIADHAAIADHLRGQYGCEATLAECGGEHVIPDHPDPSRAVVPLPEGEFALAVCRIEPENNVETVLEAFSRMPERRLVFVGNWDRTAQGRALRARYARFANIDTLDPIYDLETLYQLRSRCAAYLHGHSAGGTNPSLVEAMAAGAPAVCYDCVYNRGTTAEMARYFIDPDDVVRIIRDTPPEEMRAMGDQLKAYAARHYSWPVIAAKYRLAIDRGVAVRRTGMRESGEAVS